jgi:hypothetical protein
MFESSAPFAFFDYFRVPYRFTPRAGASASDGYGSLWKSPDEGVVGRVLWWPLTNGDLEPPRGSGVLGRYRLNGTWIFAHVVPDPVAKEFLASVGNGWASLTSVSDEDGRVVASVWRDVAGNVFLPFDPGECMWYLWSERYRDVRRSSLGVKARSAAMRAYYLIRPAVPRRMQIALRRAFAKAQGKPSFPRWPLETTLHDLYDWLFEVVADLAGTRVPWIDPWPDGHTWAIVLTHDVEARKGYGQLSLLRDIEREAGFRSSWNFVPLREPERDRYEVSASVLGDLAREDCEVGVHGLRHDGRDLESLSTLTSRLPAIRSYAERWNASGFRAPATQREWGWMPLLGFDYDSSSSDSDPYEPIPGGCCSYLPFFNDEMVELPITLPQDHTLFAILNEPDGAVWLRKAADVRNRGGMVLVLTHPDYADDERILRAYRQLLGEFRDDPTVWRALPREVSAWWRHRAGSRLVATEAGWEIRGAAAGEGRVRFAEPSPQQTGTDERRAIDAAAPGAPLW